MEFFKIVQTSVLLFMEVVIYVMMIRAIMSLFASEESKLLQICYAISEPVVAPVRALLDHVPGLRDIGIDFSFIGTFLVLEIVRIILLSV